MDATADVVVAGAGAAGMAAAIASARAGKKTLLLEKGPQVGGTVAHALIHTIGGLFDDKGNLLNAGLPAELADRLACKGRNVKPRQMGRTWVLNADPTDYLEVVTRWLGEEKNLTVRCGSPIDAAIEAKSYIDATGEAALVRLLAPGKVPPIANRMAGGLITQLKDVEEGAVASPRGAALHHCIKEMAAKGALPANAARAWIDSGVDDSECYMKLFVPLGANPDAALKDALSTRDALLVYLKKEFPAFAKASVGRTGALGIRDNGQVAGDYCLTADDVRAGKKFTDAACKAAWPIEYWDTEKGLVLEYLPEGLHYDIPLRALRVAGRGNLWVAGKCISADPYARASARVAGTCWAMGEAVGKAA